MINYAGTHTHTHKVPGSTVIAGLCVRLCSRVPCVCVCVCVCVCTPCPGGRMDTVEFSKKWREKYPNESLAHWTHPAPNSTVPLSEILRASPRFSVQRGYTFSKVLYIVTFYSNFTRALTFENFCQGKKQTPPTSSSLSAWIKRLRRRRAGLRPARSPTRGCRRQLILKSPIHGDFVMNVIGL
jgi:hypothetical protein